jgi:hypothetical protein
MRVFLVNFYKGAGHTLALGLGLFGLAVAMAGLLGAWIVRQAYIDWSIILIGTMITLLASAIMVWGAVCLCTMALNFRPGR